MHTDGNLYAAYVMAFSMYVKQTMGFSVNVDTLYFQYYFDY